MDAAIRARRRWEIVGHDLRRREKLHNKISHQGTIGWEETELRSDLVTLIWDRLKKMQHTNQLKN